MAQFQTVVRIHVACKLAKVIISVPASNVFDSTSSPITCVSRISSKYSRLDLPGLISFVEVRGSLAVCLRDTPRKRGLIIEREFAH